MGAAYLANAIQHNTVRSVFYLSTLYIHSHLSIQTLTMIDLIRNEIGCAGVRYIANAAKRNIVRLTLY